MREGKARGGPRDGVKLSAPETWDGLVLDGAGKYHRGYYCWFVTEQTWVWITALHKIDWVTRHYHSRQL